MTIVPRYDIPQNDPEDKPKEPSKKYPVFKMDMKKHFPDPKWVEGGRNHSCYTPGGM